MNKEEAVKQFKSMFPEDIEAIVLTKENYNDMVNKLQYENIQLQERIDKAIEYLEYQLENLDFEKDTKAKMLGAMVIVLLKGDNK